MVPTLRYPLFAALCVLCAYLPALRNDLVWDDTVFLEGLPHYRLAQEGIFETAFKNFILGLNYFRPLPLASFMIDLKIWGPSPLALHFTNVLLHSLNTFLIGMLFVAIAPRSPSRVALFVLPLLYGLHPVLLESTVFVSSRFDLLLTTFLLLALLADRTLKRRSIPLGLAFLCAALSKEMAVAFLFSLVCFHLALSKVNVWRTNRLVYGAVLLSGICYLLIRRLSLGYLLLPLPGEAISAGGTLQHFMLIGRSLFQYLSLILWPFSRLTPIHYAALPLDSSLFVNQLALVFLLCSLPLVLLIQKKLPSQGWLFAAFLLALLPTINILPLELGGGAFVAERFLTFPLVFLVLVFGTLFFTPLSYRGEKVLRICISTWLMACLLTIELTIPHWCNDFSLWSWAEKRAPASSIVLSNLALAHYNLREFERGLSVSKRALAQDAGDADAWSNHGLLLAGLKRYSEAEHAFRMAAAFEPESSLHWSNLAAALREQNRLEEAEALLRSKVLTRDPLMPSAHLNLGLILIRSNRFSEARTHLEAALRLLPPEEKKTAQQLLDRLPNS